MCISLKATLLGSYWAKRYRTDPAKLLESNFDSRCGKVRRILKEQKEENKLVPIIVRIPKYKKEMLEKFAAKQGLHEVDIVRNGIDKELNLEMYRDNLDFIIKELNKMIEAKLDPFIKSQRKINAKHLRTSAINTYLQGEVLYRLLGDDMHENFKQMLTNARKKANYYISHDTEGMSKKDLYDFYTIGEMYRNE